MNVYKPHSHDDLPFMGKELRYLIYLPFQPTMAPLFESMMLRISWCFGPFWVVYVGHLFLSPEIMIFLDKPSYKTKPQRNHKGCLA